MRTYIDINFKFKEIFNPNTGFYLRTDNDSGEDPFMRSVPSLIDIGIMGSCEHGRTGLCLKAGIECYQSGNNVKKQNMALEDYKKIIDNTKEYVFQVALGGRGDPDMHENFEDILKYTRENSIVPNFTTSGLGMTPKKASICKTYCGAVAISMYSRIIDTPFVAIRERENNEEKTPYTSIDNIPVVFTMNNLNNNCFINEDYYIINNKKYNCEYLDRISDADLNGKYEIYRIYKEKQNPNYTMRAIKMLLDAGVKTNIHYVLSNTTIDEAILRLKYNGFPKGINAIIFLLHKPIGLGSKKNVLQNNDPRLKEFFKLIDENKYSFKIGFDSCTVPGIINNCKKINIDSIDSCEAARYSMYIDSEMNAYPCSFDNEAKKFLFKLDYSNNIGIEEAWNSVEFNNFRQHFNNSCKNCKNHNICLGGCPLSRNIILCENKEKDLK